MDGQLAPRPDGYAIKLVRDRTPNIVNATGQPGELFYAPFDGDLLPLLRQKLIEEVGEYLIGGKLAELSHVAGVLRALAEREGMSLADLLAAFDADPRGGFEAGIVMFGRHPEYDR